MGRINFKIGDKVTIIADSKQKEEMGIHRSIDLSGIWIITKNAYLLKSKVAGTVFVTPTESNQPLGNGNTGWFIKCIFLKKIDQQLMLFEI